MSRQRIVFTWTGGIPREFRKGSTFPVALATQQGKLRFGIHALLKQLKVYHKKPDPLGLELGLVALAVWVADTRLSRARISEDNWTREIELIIPVRDPDLWNSHAAHVERLLGTLSGDIWRLRFSRATSELRSYIDEMCSNARPGSAAPPIALFSGGLDSYVGAINSLAPEGIRPVFVSQLDGGNSATVEELKTLLSQRYGESISLIRWKVSCSARDLGDDFSGGGELTMRARSFLFFAASALVATAYGSDRVVVPENGFISLNVPLDPWRLGALTTRTTHPFVLARFNDLLALLGLSVTLENPFQGLTKGEVLAKCANRNVLWEGLPLTVSCSKPKWVRRYRAQFGTSHCGTCWPCVIRRAAVRKAFPSERDPTRYLAERLANLRTESGEAGHVVRSIEYGLNMLRMPDQYLRLALSSVAPLRDVNSEIPALVACLRRGLTEIARFAELPVPL